MSGHSHEEHSEPQPVLVPFLLLCLAIAVIGGIGYFYNGSIEEYAGIGIAHKPGQTVATEPVSVPSPPLIKHGTEFTPAAPADMNTGKAQSGSGNGRMNGGTSR